MFIVVQAVDVNGAPLKLKKLPTLFIDTIGPGAPFKATPQPGTFEAPLPDRPSLRLTVSFDEPDFWSFDQFIDVTAPPDQWPTLAWAGVQQLGSWHLVVHSRGSSDFNLQARFSLAQLKDARFEVDQAMGAVNAGEPGLISFEPVAQLVRKFDPILLRDKAGGFGWGKFSFLTSDDERPGGTVFVAQRQTAPKLVYAYVPAGTFASGRDDRVPYHIFFHPTTSHIHDPYPFGREFVWLPSRYLIKDRANHGYCMANQHHVAGKRPVFVFPIGSPSTSFGTTPTQAGILRLLQELSWFLQRKHNIALPTQRVGKVAVSGFSAGATPVKLMLDSPLPAFEENHLREIYGIDFHLDGRADVDAMCARLRSWVKAGDGDRRLRVYTTKDSWAENLQKLGGESTPRVSGAKGAFVEDTPFSTLFAAVSPLFWQELQAEVKPAHGEWDAAPAWYDPVHHIIPQLFVEHAIRMSSFAG